LPSLPKTKSYEIASLPPYHFREKPPRKKRTNAKLFYSVTCILTFYEAVNFKLAEMVKMGYSAAEKILFVFLFIQKF